MVAAKRPSALDGRVPLDREHPKGIPIERTGWTPAMIAEARRRVASFLDDWEDPRMDVYDEDP